MFNEDYFREQFELAFRKAHPGEPHLDEGLELINFGTEGNPEWLYTSTEARKLWDWWLSGAQCATLGMLEILTSDND